MRQKDGAKAMGAIEELQQDCGYCRQPNTLKWKNGPMPSEGECLVVDQVLHDICWAMFLADSNGKRALVGARCGAGTA
jgi:hypothetical protein